MLWRPQFGYVTPLGRADGAGTLACAVWPAVGDAALLLLLLPLLPPPMRSR